MEKISQLQGKINKKKKNSLDTKKISQNALYSGIISNILNHISPYPLTDYVKKKSGYWYSTDRLTFISAGKPVKNACFFFNTWSIDCEFHSVLPLF